MTTHMTGCRAETIDSFPWPETDIGQTVQLPCPCEDILQFGSSVRRMCGGSPTSEWEWMDVDHSECATSMSHITNTLCRIAMVLLLSLSLTYIQWNLRTKDTLGTIEIQTFCPLWRGCPLVGGFQCMGTIGMDFVTTSSVPCRQV